MRRQRKVGWVKAARKDFEKFPQAVQDVMATTLTLAASGRTADNAKPMRGLGAGVFEIATPYRGDAYRSVYATQIGDVLWVVHAFQKKSKSGIATPKKEIDLIKSRLRQLKEAT